MDLGLAALDVAPLLARLKVLSPAAVPHLLLQQEAAGLLHLRTGNSGGQWWGQKCGVYDRVLERPGTEQENIPKAVSQMR